MSERVRLLWCNHSRLRPGQFMRPHSHASFQLYYIYSGSPVFHVADRVFTVPGGSYFVVPRFVQHSMDALHKNNEGSEFKLLIDDPALAARFALPAGPIRDDGTVKRLLDYVLNNWTSPDESNTANIEAILTAVLLTFFAGELDYKASSSRFITTDGYDELTRNILVAVERDYSYPFSMEKLSGELSYSKNYLSTVFRRNTGAAVIDYLNLLRVRGAVIHFYYYGQDVYSTCECVGFSNLSYFSRTFRKYTGISPRRFKKALASPAAAEPLPAAILEPLISYRILPLAELSAALRRLKEFCDAVLPEENATE